MQAWQEHRPTLEARREQVLDVMLDLLGRQIDQQQQPPPLRQPLTQEQETMAFWGLKH